MARILLIEDNHIFRFSMKRFLEKADHEVVEASNGEEGIQAFRAKPSDIVITDIFMPVKEGLTTIKELQQEFGDVKIIAMTGGGKINISDAITSDVLTAAKKLGALKTFQKPFKMDQMKASIDEILA